MGFQAVILDVDGTLVDSNEGHVQAFYEAIQEAGYEASHDELRKLMGMGSDNLLPVAIKVEKDSPIRKQIAERRKQIFTERFLPNLKPFPQVRELVQRMHDDGFTLVVASSGEIEEVEAMLDIAGVTEFIDDITSAADVKNSKPQPDVIRATLDKLVRSADQVVMMGDTPYDIMAAARCGVGVIGLRSGGFTTEELRGALAIYDDPADLLAHYDESVLGTGQRILR